MYITIIYDEHWCLIARQQSDWIRVFGNRNESVYVQESEQHGAIDEPKGLGPVTGVLIFSLITTIVMLNLVGEAIMAAEV